MSDLSIIIPARNEEFLLHTVQDVLMKIEADTEIIVILDGSWPIDSIPDNPIVTLVYHETSIGQRAAVNEGVRLARGKYIMKLDAHCSVGQGFDRILIEDIQSDWTIVPRMYNLHVFDWVCGKCGYRRYQGPTPVSCPECNNVEDFYKDIIWQAKKSPESTSMKFDNELRFGYWSGFKKHQKGNLVETMSILGACWMMERERFLDLQPVDERHGSYGQMGTEIACVTWLSGGKLICNKRTWFAHMFRTQGGDFGFPYPLSGKAQEQAREYSKDLWFNNRHPKQILPLRWLIERFWPVPGWDNDDLERLRNINFQEGKASKGIVYYTDNRLKPEIMVACQQQLAQSLNGYPLITVSLDPLEFGNNISLGLERGYLTMFRQILTGLENIQADVVFLCEHDILYHPSHFEFVPGRNDLYYYNQNVWKVDYETGRCLFYYVNQTSGLCAHRELLLQHYRKRVEIVEEHGYSRRMGFEPGTHNRKERVDRFGHETWMSEYPNIDIRHNYNLTPSRWSQDQFRNKKYCRGWTEADEVPGWGQPKTILKEIESQLHTA